MAFLFLILGLGMLIGGAEFLIKGSVALSKRLGLSAFVIGVFIVALGTSLPEFTVSVISALEHVPGTIMGTIIGSNIANILLILGVTATIKPVRIKRDMTWHDIPVSIGVSALLLILASKTHELNALDGAVFLFLFLMYFAYLFHKQRKRGEPEELNHTLSTELAFVLIFAGTIGLFLGGKLLIDNVQVFASAAGISPVLIGLTVIALGTSLPELITSIVAVISKQEEISIGNIIGSNIINILWILGFASLLTPLPVNTSLMVDMGVSVAATVLMWIFLLTGKKYHLERWHGIVFLCSYVAFIIFLFVRG